MSLALRSAFALTLTIVTASQVAALAPPAPIDPAQVADLVQKLDADAFRVRQQADQSLRAMGQAVLPLLRAEMTRASSFEVKDRLRQIEQDLTVEVRFAELVQLLAHPDKRLHKHADITLRNAGLAALPTLKKELATVRSPLHRQRVEALISALSGSAR